jgi:hypothetical protein
MVAAGFKAGGDRMVPVMNVSRLAVLCMAIALCLAAAWLATALIVRRDAARPEGPEGAPGTGAAVSATPSFPGDGGDAAHRRPDRRRDPQERKARHSRVSAERLQAFAERLRSADSSRPGPRGSRAFVRRPSPAQQEILGTALERFQAATEPSAKLEILDELAEIPHLDTLAVVKRALLDDDADIRQRALEVIEGYTTAETLPLIKAALADPDADVRLAAVNALAAITDSGAKALLMAALSDSEQEVREAVFAGLESQSADTRLDVYGAGIVSAYEDVWENVVSAILFAPTQDAMYVLLEGLREPGSEKHQRTNSALYFLLSEQFETYDEGLRWWDANRDRFDASVEEKMP